MVYYFIGAGLLVLNAGTCSLIAVEKGRAADGASLPFVNGILFGIFALIYYCAVPALEVKAKVAPEIQETPKYSNIKSPAASLFEADWGR